MGVKKERNYEQNKTNTKTDKQKVFNQKGKARRRGAEREKQKVVISKW